MQYEGRIDQKRALIDALRILAGRGVSDQVVARAIENACLEGKVRGFPAKNKARVSRATIQRFREKYEPETASMKYESAGLIYNYLRHSEALETPLRGIPTLTDASHTLSPLIGLFQEHFGSDGQPYHEDALRSLEGTFYVYRKAWSSIKHKTFMRSVLRFELFSSSLIYTDEQDCFDPISGIKIKESDTGFVMPFNVDMIMIGRGNTKDLLKFSALHTFSPYPNGIELVDSFTGTITVVYNTWQQLGAPIYAKRVDPKNAESKFYNEGELDKEIERMLLAPIKKQAETLLSP